MITTTIIELTIILTSAVGINFSWPMGFYHKFQGFISLDLKMFSYHFNDWMKPH
jgi:hypothetical protein